jgi:nucleotide-binding universal stress UspA family protein
MQADTDPSKFSCVLIAIDGSSLAEKGGFIAVDLAKRYSANVIILHVAKYPPNTLGRGPEHSIPVGLPLSDPLAENLKRHAIASLDRIAAYARKLDVPSSRLVVDTSSSIVETIVNHAYSNNVDLIVLGCRGMNEYKATLTGNVAEGIVDEARCTIMIVR